MSTRPTARPSAPRLRARALAGLAAATALTVALPAAACAQSASPGSESGSVGSDALGSAGSSGSGSGSSGTSGSLGSGSLGSSGIPAPTLPGPGVTTEQVLDGLTIPWDVVSDPAGVVVTGERGTGTIHAVHPDGRETTVEADLGRIANAGESGLLGIALAADFATSREVYTCHSSANHSDNRVTAWRAADDWSRLESPRVLVSDIPLAERGLHSGCRILAHPDGTLYIGTGDAFTGPAPQDLDSLAGKILHVTRDGEPAEGTIGDSPVLTYGHRNVQGLALQPGTGRVFSGEHGPDVDDEVNLLRPGGNYGWNPNRGGRYDQSVPMTDTAAFPDAVRPTWASGSPTLAPAGIAFLDHPSWGEWNGALAVAMLKTKRVLLLRLSEDGQSVTDTAVILDDTNGRLRSITPTPDGSLLLTTSNGGGRDEVVRVRPA